MAANWLKRPAQTPSAGMLRIPALFQPKLEHQIEYRVNAAFKAD